MTIFDSLKSKFQIFMINSNSGLQTIWKSGLVWLSRPIFMVWVISAKFGPFWTSKSQIAWATPIFYWLHRFCIPKGTWNWPYFGWDIFLHFCLGSKSQETPVSYWSIFVFKFVVSVKYPAVIWMVVDITWPVSHYAT